MRHTDKCLTAVNLIDASRVGVSGIGVSLAGASRVGLSGIGMSLVGISSGGVRLIDTSHSGGVGGT